jgi:cleavage and polyadenylation specificity factor subunit 3
MTRFKSKLLSLNSSKPRPIKVYSPANCEELRIPFKREKFAKVVGRLAQIPPPKLLRSITESGDESMEDEVEDERIVSGVLVQNGFNLTLMAPEDLKEYAGLTTTTITFKKRLFCSAGVDLIRWGLEGMFGGIKQISPSANGALKSNGKANGAVSWRDEAVEGEISRPTTFLVMDCVNVEILPSGEVCLEWEGNMMNDAVADSVLAVLLQMETGMVGVKRRRIHSDNFIPKTNHTPGSGSHSPHHTHATKNPHTTTPTSTPTTQSSRLSRLLWLLEDQFGELIEPITRSGKDNNGGGAEPDAFAPGLEITVAPHTARVWLADLSIECANPALKSRVLAVVEKASETVAGMA